jgi:hypothetical protein
MKTTITKKQKVIGLLEKGADLVAIMKVTGWQPHTCRGFLSLLRSKGGLRIKREEDGRYLLVAKKKASKKAALPKAAQPAEQKGAAKEGEK